MAQAIATPEQSFYPRATQPTGGELLSLKDSLCSMQAQIKEMEGSQSEIRSQRSQNRLEKYKESLLSNSRMK